MSNDNNYNPDNIELDDGLRIVYVVSSDANKKGLWITLAKGMAIQIRILADANDVIYFRKLLYSGGNLYWGAMKTL